MSVKSNPLDTEKLNMIIAPQRVSNICGATPTRKMLHEEIEIKYFYEGSSTLLIGTQTVTAAAGDVVVINPYEFHATIDCSEEKGKYHLLMIPLDYFTSAEADDIDLRTLLLAKNQSFKTFFGGDKHLASIIERIVTEYTEKGDWFRIAIKGLATELFATLLRYGLVRRADSRDDNDILHLYELIEPSLDHIRNNYFEDITVDELAGICKISKYYFCRIFKTVTKKTAMEYLRDYRLEIADIMLTNTDKSISEIAEYCGFGDSNYFCRYYKSRRGISPGKHKKEKLNSEKQ